MTLQLHPYAELFPVMSHEELTWLQSSIEARGQEEPIVLYEGKVLDGRNRLRVCDALGLKPKTIKYDGDDPLGYVIAKNYARRHLTESQRALVAARIANLSHGGDRKSNQVANLPLDSITQAAEKLHVSARTVRDARKVLSTANSELIKAVETGRIAVSAATQIATLPERDQRDIALTKDDMARRSKVKAAKELARARKAKEGESDIRPLVLVGARSNLALAERSYTIAQWDKLSKKERQEIIDGGFECTAKMNNQPSDNIEWARRSLNTVTGCLHDCPYCYARDIANSARMARVYPHKFAPVFHPSRLSAPASESVPDEASIDPAYRNIFANSMSDLFGKWVPREWIEATIDMATRNPPWNFLVLTKFPQRAAEFTFPKNWWMGTTVDAQSRVANAERAFERIVCGTKWLSVEPLLERLTFTRLDLFQWIVIGGSSASNKTPAWIPTMDLIAPLHVAAREAGLRIYYKTNCGMYDELRGHEFPWTKVVERPLPKVFRYLKGM